jgi:hypothetical protein
MPSSSLPLIQRRDFLKLAGLFAATGISGQALAGRADGVVIVIDRNDSGAASDPVRWAAEQLRQAIEATGTRAEIATANPAPEAATLVLVGGAGALRERGFRPLDGDAREDRLPESEEGFRIAAGRVAETPAISVSANDPRGFVYALLELAERAGTGHGTDSLRPARAVTAAPSNQIRSVARAFCSEIEDKSWFYDREFWPRYLDALAQSRFNRFNFAFGFGYDFPSGVTGDYFQFPYPYLLDVPGYRVRVVPLDDAERERNLQTLQYIAAETAARGLQFQLGIWTHAYQWTNSPHSDHHIVGLTPETHAAYCRDALLLLLKSCPEIQGLTMRIHGESGIPEGSYPFWQTLFDALPACGRKVEIDMHAKGINQIMIDMAVKTGMPVKVSPKYSAEHQSLGYHQADIRALEIPKPGQTSKGMYSVSGGARLFTRYGYSDLFQEGRRYDVLFRLWPGTQRHLLWGDPETAAAYGRTSNFCGAVGLEICEPLTFKGREGSGHPGGRCAYKKAALNPTGGDWEKFEYTYRLWGRLLYNPDADPEGWRRMLRRPFGAGAIPVEGALANASRILPLMTTAHLPSGSNHSYWPEMYTNMRIPENGPASPYGDTPSPKVFANVSPLDPQLFSTIAEHVDDLLAARPNAKYSPAEVADWLDKFTAASAGHLAEARLKSKSAEGPEFQRMEEDVLIQNGLGSFFAAKMRSAIYFEIFRRTGNREAGRLAQAEYAKARATWASMAVRAEGVYVSDVSYGSVPIRKGHWSDRLAAIDADIAAMQAQLESATGYDNAAAVEAAGKRTVRPAATCTHTPPQAFRPGQPLALSLQARGTSGRITSILLHYRHVNHAERWQKTEMEESGGIYRVSIPRDYTDSPYPLQYYFELRDEEKAWLYPGFNTTLSNQPYFAISTRSISAA